MLHRLSGLANVKIGILLFLNWFVSFCFLKKVLKKHQFSFGSCFSCMFPFVGFAFLGFAFSSAAFAFFFI